MSQRGDIIQMRPILDNSGAISLDSLNANEVGLEALCHMLLDEAKSRMPRHQRRVEFMKAKSAPNEKHGKRIERLRTLVELLN